MSQLKRKSLQKQGLKQIFEVSINSKKLISILSQFQQNFSQINNRLQQMQQSRKQGDFILGRKISSTQTLMQSKFQQELKKLRRQIQEHNRQNEYKQVQQVSLKQQKINELKSAFDMINQKIVKTNLNFQQQINQCIKNYTTDIFTLKRNLEKSQENDQIKFTQMSEQMDLVLNDNAINKQNIFQMDIKINRATDIFMKGSHQARFIQCPDKKFQDSFNHQKYGNLADKQNSISDKSPKKRKLGLALNDESNENYMSTLQYASITVKVQNLQRQLLSSNQTDPTNQILLPRRKQSRMQKTFFSHNRQRNQHSQTQFQQGSQQLLKSILKKLQQISSTVQTKQQNLKKLIDQLSNQQIITTQKNQFIRQKQLKIIAQLADLKVKFLTLDKKTQQQNKFVSITNIQEQIGKIIQRLDNELPKKVDLKDFKNQKDQIWKKINLINETIIFKAQKQDVKKAIHFIEDKIKDIILVMANQFNQQKIGAISKIPTKCLTCDKQIYRNDNLRTQTSQGLKRLKSPRQVGQKYLARLVNSKKVISSTKKNYRNMTSVTQLGDQFE